MPTAKHFIHRDIKPTNVIVADIDGKETALLAISAWRASTRRRRSAA